MTFNITETEKVKGVGAEFMLVTPDLAAVWLTGHTNYRNLNRHRVASLARDMTEGKWHTNGESIKFDLDGILTDGQHRLRAVIASGTPILTLVTWTADNSGVDRGQPRSFSNLLQNMGVKNAITIQATVRLLKMWYETGVIPPQNPYMTDDELLAFMDTLDPGVLQECARRSGILIKLGMGTRASWTSCLYRFMEIDPEGADNFYEHIRTGASLSPGHPCLTLRNRLLTLRASTITHRVPSNEFLSAIITKTWNAYYEGRTLSVIKFLVDESFPKLVTTKHERGVAA